LSSVNPEFPELRDIVIRPEPVDYVPWIVGGALAAAVLLVLAVWLWRSLARRMGRPRPPALPGPFAGEAIAAIRRLEAEADTLPVEELTREIDRTISVYLHRARGALALYRTTDELVGRRRASSPPPNPRLEGFESVLRRCEALRYGGSPGLDAQDKRALIAAALEALDRERAAADPAPHPKAADVPAR